MEYIGIHSTDNINDGYFGSGKYLNLAIKKYGKGIFEKTIIEYFDNRHDALKRESEIVSIAYIKNKKNYNLVLGGGNPLGRNETLNKYSISDTQRIIDFNNPDGEWNSYIADVPKDQQIRFYFDKKAYLEVCSSFDVIESEDCKKLREKLSNIVLNQMDKFAENLTLCFNNRFHRDAAREVLKKLYDNGMLNNIIKYKQVA